MSAELVETNCSTPVFILDWGDSNELLEAFILPS